MNPLLNQFVTEGRDLLEQASRALLALERNNQDASELDALFRAVHTIKGASGLFDFAPFLHTVHAGEDLLDAVRAGDVVFTPDIADLVLEMLDRVAAWLEDLERQEELGDGAEAIGEDLSNRLRACIGEADGDTPAATVSAEAQVSAPWPEDLPVSAADIGAEGGPIALIRYRPLETAFFTGDDPLRMVLSAPGLRWVDVVPPSERPALKDLDPFLICTSYRLLCSASSEELEEHFRYVADQIEITPLAAGTAGAAEASPLADIARALLDSQAQVLDNLPEGPQAKGSLGAVHEVLHRIATTLEAADIAESLKTSSPEEASVDGLRAAIDSLLAAIGPKPEATSVAATPARSGSAASARVQDAAQDAPSEAPMRKSSVLRVDADRIDALMNLTGELIVAKNAMPFLARKAEEIEGTRDLLREIKAQHDAINRITEELQTAIMQIRMVPVGSVLGRFNRLVRDLSRKLGKKIELQTEGEETEADKAVVEELSEPLVHLIRNAIDHGLELPEARKEAGKSETGLIHLKASQRDDSVVIEIRDDGCGIDVEKVKAKALERGVIDEEGLSRLSRDAELQLILTPGLSTKEEISDLSGRGVGMDVVASMVRRLGGSVSLSSEPGQGTTVRIALPLSMAVQRLMMIEVENGLYGVPIESVIESQKIPTSRIRRHREGEMILLRDRLIPLLRLRRLFACGTESDSDTISVMIVDVEGAEIGLVVDRFHAGVDAIVKPMSGLLSQTSCYSGTALLGDGSVLLALDLPEVVECQFH